MSADAQPITPARFAAALKDLPISALHLKVLELRNSIAHLDYSNEQLRPFAEGTATALSPSTAPSTGAATRSEAQTSPQPQIPPQIHTQRPTQPDQDCIDAIRENELVIERMQERIRLVRAEVESRGLAWAEFQTDAEREVERRKDGIEADAETNVVNGETTTAEGTEDARHRAWTDGTFQTGVISGGALRMDGLSQPRGQGQGGSLTDQELSRRMEEQLRALDGEMDEEEGGLHL